MSAPRPALLAHPGTQHAPRLARELHARGLLHSFWTGLAFAEGSATDRVARGLARLPHLGGLSSRQIRGVPPALLHLQPLSELRALARLSRGAASEPVIHARNERFQHGIPDSALVGADAIIGFDTSSWLLAARARRLGRPFLLDRTAAHPDAIGRIMHDVRARYPEWPTRETTRHPALRAAEAAEHALADRIVVAGGFARASLLEAGIAPERIAVIPYGVDWARFAPPSSAGPARPFRFLYVGTISARKGVPVLLEAWNRLRPREAELWIAGHAGPAERALIPDLPGLKRLGHIPQGQLPAIYAECDVFVLPSFSEGFGLVLLEALAAGLPLISTPQTAAIDLVDSSALGRVVAPGSVDELHAALAQALAQPPDRHATLAAAAALRTRFSWETYGHRWAELLAAAL